MLFVQGVPQKLAYSFDTGICSKGLLDCFAITKEEKFLEYAKKLNQWILNETIENNGFVKPTKNLQTNEFEEDTNVWYKRSGCLHIKLTIPLLQQYMITKNESLLETATKIADSIPAYQNDDGSIFLNTDDFGQTATYTPQGGSASTINGILDKESEDIEGGGEIGVIYSVTTFTCRTADVSSAAFGDSLATGGTTYTVRKVEPDGNGITVLTIEA